MIKHALKKGILFKPIIGASIQNPSLAKLFAHIYALAGALLIDVRGEAKMVRAVREGIKEAGGSTAVIASVSPMQNDPHFLKAAIDWMACEGCGQCEAVCPHGAISILEINKARVTTENCRGCGHCLDVCPSTAIKLTDPERADSLQGIVRECMDAGADSIEFHLSGMNDNEVHSVISSLKDEIRTINSGGYPVSICVGSLQSSPAEILEVVKMLISLLGSEGFFIQADGETMAETKRGYGLQSLALVSLITGAYPNVRVIASGGTTEKTWDVARMLKIPISGIGMGLRSFEAVKPYIFGDQISDVTDAVSAARTLSCPFESMNNDHDETLFKGSAWHTLNSREAYNETIITESKWS